MPIKMNIEIIITPPEETEKVIDLMVRSHITRVLGRAVVDAYELWAQQVTNYGMISEGAWGCKVCVTGDELEPELPIGEK